MSPVKSASFFSPKNLTPVPSAGLSRYYGELQGRQGKQRPGIKGKGSPVKFAALVFFEEFNGTSRG